MSRLLVVIGWLNGWLVTSCCNGLLIITAKCIIGCVVCTSVVYLECTVVNCTSTSTSTSILAGIVHFLLCFGYAKKRRRVPDPENIHSYNQKCVVSVRKEKSPPHLQPVVLQIIQGFHSQRIQQHQKMIEIQANDRLGKKIKLKCLPTDTIGDVKKILALQIGTPAEKLILKKVTKYTKIISL